MRFTFLTLICFLSVRVFAEGKVSVKIKEIHNVARSEAMEVCGEANHTEGKKPLLVTLLHDKSSYTTLTDKNGKWCTVIKRWNFSGTVDAEASTLDFSESSSL